MDTILKNALPSGPAFIITLALITILFIVCLFLSLIKNNYTLRKRVWYFSASCGIILFVSTVFKENNLIQIILSLLLVYFGIIFSISPKKEKKDELDEFIDRQIELPIKIEDRKPVRETEQKLSVLPVPERIKNPEIDYSHVKSVIERISLLSLSQSDRKTVKELELCVLGAENGDDRIETKRKINDGLGALLKIMSKYGA